MLPSVIASHNDGQCPINLKFIFTCSICLEIMATLFRHLKSISTA